MSLRRSPRRTSSSKANSRRALSSTPISSPRPALLAASATASRSKPARRRPIWIATTSRRSWNRARAGADHPDGGRRRLRRQARSVDPALHRGRRLAARPPGAHGLFAPRIDHDDDQAPSGAHASRRSARCATDVSSRWTSQPISTPAPTPPGDRRSPTACRSTPPAPIACRTTVRWRAPSTRISCPQAHFAASACRRARSRKSNSTTSSRFA